MYKDSRMAIVIPAYNEEKLIAKTIGTVPDFMDYIITINDGSSDKTLEIQKDLAAKDKRIIVVDNGKNLGLGSSMVVGFKRVLETDADMVCVIAGDGQCDTSYISKMADELLDNDLDYVKANRFVHLEQLAAMPTYRRIGNVIITIMTKFSTGYYSVFDSQNGYGIFRRRILEKMSLGLIGKRYDYENTLLTALSIAGAKVRDYPVPAVYGEEKSTIPVFSTALRAIKANWVGFWKRIYYKYIVYNFHPIALFLIVGLLLSLIGLGFGVFALYEKAVHDLTPSTGTIMLVILPLLVGFQLLLTAFMMDMRNEGKD